MRSPSSLSQQRQPGLGPNQRLTAQEGLPQRLQRQQVLQARAVVTPCLSLLLLRRQRRRLVSLPGADCSTLPAWTTTSRWARLLKP